MSKNQLESSMVFYKSENDAMINLEDMYEQALKVAEGLSGMSFALKISLEHIHGLSIQEQEFISTVADVLETYREKISAFTPAMPCMNIELRPKE